MSYYDEIMWDGARMFHVITYRKSDYSSTIPEWIWHKQIGDEP